MRLFGTLIAFAGVALLAVLPKGSREVVRLRAHFDSVDVELRQADVAGLNRDQRESREELIAWLRGYRSAGSFPVNDRFPDRAMPFFRDSRGVLCAMAYLIARSGRVDLVDRIARSRNNAFIADLSSDTELVRWLDSVGLTAAEAARIQPSYGNEPGSKVSTGFAVGSLVLGGGALVASGFNIFSPTTASGWLGVAAGVGAGILGAAHIAETGTDEAIALADLLIGVTAVGLGIRGIVVGGRDPKTAATSASDGTRGIELGMSPSFTSPNGRPGFGLMLQARF